MEVCDEALDVSPGETASSADLGGSSKYSSENSLKTEVEQGSM